MKELSAVISQEQRTRVGRRVAFRMGWAGLSKVGALRFERAAVKAEVR